MPFQLAFQRHQLGSYTYASLRVRGTDTVVLDFWHKAPDEEPYIAGNAAMNRFKEGAEPVVAAFAQALGAIAGHFEHAHFDYIVPMIGARREAATLTSPVGRLAAAASHRLGIPTNVDLFRQTPRQRLHGGPVLVRDERYDIVYPNLAAVGRHRGVRVLLVDDVISSGATAEAYRDRLAEAGGEVYAMLGVMKFAQEQPLLNPRLYARLAH